MLYSSFNFIQDSISSFTSGNKLHNFNNKLKGIKPIHSTNNVDNEIELLYINLLSTNNDKVKSYGWKNLLCRELLFGKQSYESLEGCFHQMVFNNISYFREFIQKKYFDLHFYMISYYCSTKLSTSHMNEIPTDLLDIFEFNSIIRNQHNGRIDQNKEFLWIFLSFLNANEKFNMPSNFNSIFSKATLNFTSQLSDIGLWNHGVKLIKESTESFHSI